MNENLSADNPQGVDFSKKLNAREAVYTCELLLFPFSDKISEQDKVKINTVLEKWKDDENPTIEGIVKDFVDVSKKCHSASWCCYFNAFKVLLVVYDRALKEKCISGECAEKYKLGKSVYDCLCASFKEYL